MIRNATTQFYYSLIKSGALRYYYSAATNQIIEVLQNPCGCHPYDILITKGTRFNEKSCISFSEEKEIKKYIKGKGWVKL